MAKSDTAVLDRSMMLLEEPYETMVFREEELVNIARWTGNWEGIDQNLRNSHDNIP